MRLPPLDIAAEVTTADGARYRWDPAARRPGDRPQNVSFRTKVGDGFADASCVLSRPVDADYFDIALMSNCAFMLADGSVVYEGRLGSNPRTLDQNGPSISLQFASWMTHAKQRKFREIYVDPDWGQWGDMPLNEKIRQAQAGADLATLSWATQAPDGLVCALPNQSLSSLQTTQTWYIAPPGCAVSKLQYRGKDVSIPAKFAGTPVSFSNADTLAGAVVTNATYDDTVRTASPSPSAATRFVAISLTGDGTGATTPAAGSTRTLSKVCAIGNHTVPLYDRGDGLSGVYASDVIKDTAARFCPKLNTTGVQATSLPLGIVAYRDRIYPYDAWLDLNKHHLWFLGCWENRTLHYEPFDLTDYDWQVKLSDQNVTTTLQGDSVDADSGSFANGIVVMYTDVLTGRLEELTPDTNPSDLADLSPGNPANQQGEKLWTELQLSSPTTGPIALQLGRAALADYNRPKQPGTINVAGHIRDRAGHWQQASKVRAGETIAITDSTGFSDAPRLIVETDYTGAPGHTQSLAIDGTFKTIDAVQDRILTALQAQNVAT